MSFHECAEEGGGANRRLPINSSDDSIVVYHFVEDAPGQDSFWTVSHAEPREVRSLTSKAHRH
jgi:hypothetical protein